MIALGMPSKKKIAYNETLSYLGGRGSKKSPIIFHLINGTFIMGGRGSEFFVSCLILKKNYSEGRCGRVSNNMFNVFLKKGRFQIKRMHFNFGSG